VRSSNLSVVLLTFLVAVVPSPARAQMLNPTTAEFDPSSDHNATLADGRPKVDRYDLEFSLVGAASPFQVASLGKPSPASDGKIRVLLSSILTSFPSPGIAYEAAVTAVGPGGVGRSAPSNQFSFTVPCSYTASPASQSVTASGGSVSVSVTTQPGCAWTAASNASWISITSGGSGSGNGTVNYAVTAHAGSTARTGTLSIAGQTVTVTQATPAPAPPTNIRIVTGQTP